MSGRHWQADRAEPSRLQGVFLAILNVLAPAAVDRPRRGYRNLFDSVKARCREERVVAEAL
jgi:hypothetical protein